MAMPAAPIEPTQDPVDTQIETQIDTQDAALSIQYGLGLFDALEEHGGKRGAIKWLNSQVLQAAKPAPPAPFITGDGNHGRGSGFSMKKIGVIPHYGIVKLQQPPNVEKGKKYPFLISEFQGVKIPEREVVIMVIKDLADDLAIGTAELIGHGVRDMLGFKGLFVWD